ncbi:MAG TPA: hypothetical protein VLJ17_08910 [Xanthobacteraceae bacterium]|nr:hypothetical protein [Xanthobacteraceae bacterium]
MLDFTNTRAFGLAFIGAFAMAICYADGMGDWRIIGLPVMGMLAYRIFFQE